MTKSLAWMLVGPQVSSLLIAVRYASRIALGSCGSA